MHVSYTFRHGVKPWQFVPEKLMMFLKDVFGQLVCGQLGWIVHRRELRLLLGLKLLDHGSGWHALAFAGFPERAPALAAEVDAKGLEDAGAPGPFGDKLANSSVQQRGSRW